MTAKNRAALIAKLQASLKKHFKPAPPSPGRPLLEHVLYAAILEESPSDLADEGYAKCEQEFFDWNEVRVTSVTELAEVLAHLPSPTTTSVRLKRCLQGVFEAFYTFDIDHLKKENLGKAVAKFESMAGFTPFVLNHVVQHGLGGHAIPVNSSAMKIMLHVGIVTPQEARTGKVPGLERAIPKNKAIEFSSTLHQAAVQFAADPLDQQIQDLIRTINPSAELPTAESEARRTSKRGTAKRSASALVATEPAPSGPPPGGGKTKASRGTKSASTAAQAESDSKTTGTASKAAKAPESKTAKPTTKTGGKAKSTAEKPPTAEKPTAKSGGKRSASTQSKPDAIAKPQGATKPKAGSAASTPTAKKTSSGSDATPGKAKPKAAQPIAAEAGNQKLTKRKPR